MAGKKKDEGKKSDTSSGKTAKGGGAKGGGKSTTTKDAGGDKASSTAKGAQSLNVRHILVRLFPFAPQSPH